MQNKRLPQKKRGYFKNSQFIIGVRSFSTLFDINLHSLHVKKWWANVQISIMFQYIENAQKFEFVDRQAGLKKNIRYSS